MRPPDMAEGIIYIPSTLPVTSDKELATDDHGKLFTERRKGLLAQLRKVPGIVKAAREFRPQELYRLQAGPAGATLQTDAEGLLEGVWRKDGKIVQHARLEKIGPALGKALTAVGSQVMLIHIAQQLAEIRKMVDKVLRGQHNDRLAQISAGIALYKDGMRMGDVQRREHCLQNACQSLRTGLEQSLLEMEAAILEAPDPDCIGFFDNLIGSVHSEARKKLTPALESYQCMLQGVATLATCYAGMGEPKAGRAALLEWCEKMDAAGIDDAARKARLVPAVNGVFMEEVWRRFPEIRRGLHSAADSLSLFDEATTPRFEIELRPAELLEAIDG